MYTNMISFHLKQARPNRLCTKGDNPTFGTYISLQILAFFSDRINWFNELY